METMMTKYWYTSSCGLIEFQVPYDAVVECSHQGSCDSDVEFWVNKLNLNLNRDNMIDMLDDTGIENVSSMSTKTLTEYVLWLAAGDIQETEEFINN